MPLIIVIKAKCKSSETIHQILNKRQAEFKGVDHQIDTYFNVNNGRLKLREGNIENHLIHYLRPNEAGPKKSEVVLFKSDPASTLKDILKIACGVLVTVDKKRAIYFIGNVKFHLDEVKELGSFLEIEAIDMYGNIGEEELLKQCKFYMDLFRVEHEDLVDLSYSDLLLKK